MTAKEKPLLQWRRELPALLIVPLKIEWGGTTTRPVGGSAYTETILVMFP